MYVNNVPMQFLFSQVARPIPKRPQLETRNSASAEHQDKSPKYQNNSKKLPKNQGTSRVPQVFMDVNSSRHTSRTIYHIVSCSYDCIGLDDTVSLLYDCIRMNLPVHSSLLSRIGNNNGSLYHRTVSDNSGILPWELCTSLYMITDIFFTHKRGKSIDPHQL